MQAQSGYGFALADASSICMKDCPVLNNLALNWVCYYPTDVNTSSWVTSATVRCHFRPAPPPR